MWLTFLTITFSNNFFINRLFDKFEEYDYARTGSTAIDKVWQNYSSNLQYVSLSQNMFVREGGAGLKTVSCLK